MIKMLQQEALNHGDKLQVIPIPRLETLKNEIEVFKASEVLNDFQKWIVNDLYQLDIPTPGWDVRSVILVAIAHPAYAQVEFVKQGEKYHFWCLAMSDFESTEKYLTAALAPKGYHIQAASTLPLKWLAVVSRLAVYGRNNICYIDEMGSFFSLAAYYSDLPCENGDWTQMRLAEKCGVCKACLKHCPTGAIKDERFLIDNQRCLSFFNESPGDFPDWLPLTAHHCLYDCLKCQISCPMNQEHVNNVIEISFNEEETDRLLAGSFREEASPDFQEKAKRLGLYQWMDSIPRNLKLLFELKDRFA